MTTEKGKNVSEQQAREAMFGSDSPEIVLQPTQPTQPTQHIGYLPINVSELPSNGLFYDKDIEISIRKAEPQTIKLYSSMDEEDILDRERAISMLVNACVDIRIGRTAMNYKDLSEFDKLFLFFAIRDFTFSTKHMPQDLILNTKCPHCNKENKLKITKQAFAYYSIPPQLMKFYDPVQRCFVLQHENFKTPLKLYVPTVGMTEVITSFIEQKNMEKQAGVGGYYSVTQLTLLMYAISDHNACTPDNLQLKIDDIVMNWEQDKYDTALDCIDLIKSNIKPVIQYKCSSCGGDTTTPIRFQKYRTIFSNQSVSRQLLGDAEETDS